MCIFKCIAMQRPESMAALRQGIVNAKNMDTTYMTVQQDYILVRNCTKKNKEHTCTSELWHKSLLLYQWQCYALLGHKFIVEGTKKPNFEWI